MVDIREQRQLENDDICSKFIGLHVTDAIAFAYMLNTPVSFADDKGNKVKEVAPDGTPMVIISARREGMNIIVETAAEGTQADNVSCKKVKEYYTASEVTKALYFVKPCLYVAEIEPRQVYFVNITKQYFIKTLLKNYYNILNGIKPVDYAELYDWEENRQVQEVSMLDINVAHKDVKGNAADKFSISAFIAEKLCTRGNLPIEDTEFIVDVANAIANELCKRTGITVSSKLVQLTGTLCTNECFCIIARAEVIVSTAEKILKGLEAKVYESKSDSQLPGDIL